MKNILFERLVPTHDLLHENKLYFCHNDCNEVIPLMSFISRYFMQAVIRDWPDTELKVFHLAQNEKKPSNQICYSAYFKTVKKRKVDITFNEIKFLTKPTMKNTKNIICKIREFCLTFLPMIRIKKKQKKNLKHEKMFEKTSKWVF